MKTLALLLLSAQAHAIAVVALPPSYRTAVPQVLMLLTSQDRLGSTGRPTGFWMEELAVPYRHFRQRGFEVHLASPKGGRPPVDPASMAAPSPSVTRFIADTRAMEALANTRVLKEIAESYDGYFVVGGHGVMWDLTDDPAAHALLGTAFDNGKVVAAVCHGPCALVNVRLKDGAPLLAQKRVTGFSDAEEAAANMATTVPFSLEKSMVAAGGLYEKASALWLPHAVRDGKLVTGQNPSSSELTARHTALAIKTFNERDVMMEFSMGRNCLQMPRFCPEGVQPVDILKDAAAEADLVFRERYERQPQHLAAALDWLGRLNALIARIAAAPEEGRKALVPELDQLTQQAHGAMQKARDD